MQYKEMCDFFGYEPSLFEKEQLLKVEHVDNSEGDFCRLVIQTTSSCNYNCEYCSKPEGSIFLSFSTFKYFIDNYLDRMPFKRIMVYYFGGEPTLNKNLPDFIDYLGQKKDPRIQQVIQSNGSESLAYYEKLIKNDYDLKISLSYHPTIIGDDIGEQKKFIKICLLLHKQQKTNGIILMLPGDEYLEHVDKIYRVLELGMGRDNCVEYFPIFQNCNTLSEESLSRFNLDSATAMKITYKENDVIKTKMISLEEMMRKRMMHFKGMKCYPGHFVLDSNGDYYKCWASQYQRKHRIANIHDNNFAAFDKIMTCPVVCENPVCLADLHPKKERIDE